MNFILCRTYVFHFIEKSGATDQLRDVLAKVIENRPSDPIAFLAD